MISVQGKFLCNNITEGFKKRCVACGVCENTCPLAAVKVYHGCYAVVEETVCVGCGKCAKSCPAGCIEMKERTAM